MKSYIVDSPLGIFALGKSGKVLEKVVFGSDPIKAAEKLNKLQSGEIIEEFLNLLEMLKKKEYNTFIFENETIARAVRDKTGFEVEVERPSKIIEKFRPRLSTQAVELKVFRSKEEFSKFLRDVTVQLTRMAITVAVAKRDLYAVQAVRTIDDLDKTLNLFVGRIREWYGLHIPELDRLIDKHETYCRLVADLGNRRNFTKENLEKEGLPKDKIAAVAEVASRSKGAEIGDEDLEWIRSFSRDVIELFKFRERAEEYVDSVMKNVAPNMSAILGSVLAARLISIAGGLENLAKMPASTLQVLGAEKALFRALKTGARPPKHGIIFQYAAIHQAPRWQRGKVARALSGKLAIAARMDAFGGEFIGDNLRKGLEKKFEEIKEKYRAPPARMRHERSRG